jgi:hypothetical protein
MILRKEVITISWRTSEKRGDNGISLGRQMVVVKHNRITSCDHNADFRIKFLTVQIRLVKGAALGYRTFPNAAPAVDNPRFSYPGMRSQLLKLIYCGKLSVRDLFLGDGRI